MKIKKQRRRKKETYTPIPRFGEQLNDVPCNKNGIPIYGERMSMRGGQ